MRTFRPILPLLSFLALPALGGGIHLVGTIRDQPGAYLESVSVQLLGRSLFATSDSSGRFSMVASAANLSTTPTTNPALRWRTHTLELDLANSSTVSLDVFGPRGERIRSMAPRILPAGSQSIPMPTDISTSWARVRIDGKTWVVSHMGGVAPGGSADAAIAPSAARAAISAVDTLLFTKTGYPSLKVPVGILDSADSIRAVFGRSSLASLASGKQMTVQFHNNTNGKYADSQIYVLVMARDAQNRYCLLDEAGNMNLAVSGQNGSQHAIALGDLSNGLQFPTYLSSGRLYISYGNKLNIPFNTAADGTVGIATPNIENPSDPNIGTDFDWIEFAVISNEIWCNTTQVDQFGLPMTLELFDTSGFASQTGITEHRSQIYSEWASETSGDFPALASAHRIVAPLHGSYSATGADSDYFNRYIDSIWSQYAASSLVITVDQGTFTGKVDAGTGKMAFTRPGDATVYHVSKPTSADVWGGMGTMATGSTIELVLESQICAAFHRHVLENPSGMHTPGAYYRKSGGDQYAEFWHNHSIGGLAYGFCYDDVDNQSSTLHTRAPRGLILSVGL